MTFKHLFLSAAVACVLCGCSSADRQKRADDKFVENLVSEMTLEEKIGQLNQLSTYYVAEYMRDEIVSGRVGSILNEVNPETINAMQRMAVEESRLGIPLLFARDVIHGFRTIFPIPLGQAATFDPELVELGARVAAEEATSCGIRWTFSPMVDVSRDARWGRIAESSGEDVLLNARMGAATVRGYQGDMRRDNPTVMAACVKHYAGYGASEGGRDYNTTSIPARQLRNVYLPPFKAAVDAGAMTLMTSFNDIDGIPATGNRHLLTDILREEWDFEGVVVTDWNSAAEMIAHGYVVDKKDAAEKALNAGVDMDMSSRAFVDHLAELLDEGRVSMSRIDDAVRNVLRLKLELGLFDNPYADTALVNATVYDPEHLAAAEKCAGESAILLKNENALLPLNAKKCRRLLVTGPMADAPWEQLGTWTFDGEESHTVTPLDALREKFGKDVEIIYRPVLEVSRSRATRAQLDALTSVARGCDAVAVFVGEEAILSGEAHCLADISLRGSQSDQIKAARRSGKPVVTVVMTGRPMTIAVEADNSDALLYVFHPGTMGGPAIADILFGEVVPSGKLPVSLPAMVGQMPLYYSRNMTGRPASGTETLVDGIAPKAGQTSLGCTSYYLDAGFGPLFPFGYGLSYTTFEYGVPETDRQSYGKGDVITATVELKNTGSCKGVEVAQLYVRDLVGSVIRPVRELKDFKRVELAAGESRTLRFSLPVSELAFCGADMCHKVEAGEFQLWISGDSASGEPVRFTIE